MKLDGTDLTLMHVDWPGIVTFNPETYMSDEAARDRLLEKVGEKAKEFVHGKIMEEIGRSR